MKRMIFHREWGPFSSHWAFGKKRRAPWYLCPWLFTPPCKAILVASLRPSYLMMICLFIRYMIKMIKRMIRSTAISTSPLSQPANTRSEAWANVCSCPSDSPSRRWLISSGVSLKARRFFLTISVSMARWIRANSQPAFCQHQNQMQWFPSF